MTRSELIKQLASSHPQLTVKDIELTVCTILDGMRVHWQKEGV